MVFKDEYSMVSLNQINEALKLSFEKIKRDMKRLEEQGQNTVNDLGVIRQNLLDYNGLKKEIEELTKRLDKLEKNPVEKEETTPQKKSLLSKILKKK